MYALEKQLNTTKTDNGAKAYNNIKDAEKTLGAEFIIS